MPVLRNLHSFIPKANNKDGQMISNCFNLKRHNLCMPSNSKDLIDTIEAWAQKIGVNLDHDPEQFV